MRLPDEWKKGIVSRLLILFIITFLILQFSCKQKITEPQELGKRDYTWTIDTLAYHESYQTLMEEIWANSPKNIFIVGHNDRMGMGTMYHFNGLSWEPVRLVVREGGTITGAITLHDIFGFNSTNVWSVGEKVFQLTYEPPIMTSDSSLIIHYNGYTWNEVGIPRHEGLTCITGFSPNYIWAGGKEGTVFRFDGIEWTVYHLGKEFYITSIEGYSQNDIFAIGNRGDKILPIDSAAHILFHFDGNSWNRIDSVLKIPGSIPGHFGTSLWSDGYNIYSLAPNIYQYSGSIWEKIFDAGVGHMTMTNANNIFATGDAIYHFNGNNWMEYIQFRSFGPIWNDVYTDGKEVFIIGNINNRTIILHGK